MSEPSVELVIEAGKPSSVYWEDVWHYRALLYFLTWRDIVVRYKQTIIGIAWAITPPLVNIVVLTFVFQKIAHLPSQGVPYPLLVLAGVLPWQFFSSVLTQGSNSLVSNSHLISKVYFPRLVIPLSSVLVSLVDFCISGFCLMGLMFWYHFIPTWKILTLPLLMALAIFAALGAGIGLAALNVRYRDVRYAIPLLVQFGLYISPVGFTSAIVPEKWRLLYSLNPMVGVIDGFRWALLGEHATLYLPGLGLSLALTAAMLGLSLSYFRKVERTFADVI